MKKIFMGLVAVFAIGMLGVSVAGAQENIKTGNDVVLSQGVVIDASYYAAGETVIIEGTVRGDVYCAGQSVEIRGMVQGDVLCAGQSLRLEGTVQGDVRVAGQSVFVGGEVERSATAMGQDVTIEGTVGRDATVTAQSARITGEVGRDLVATTDRMVLDGRVGRNIEATVMLLALRDNARIGGDVYYMSDTEAERAGGAEVGGALERRDLPQETTTSPHPMAWLWGAILTFIFLLPLGALLIAIMPRAAGSGVELIRRRTLLVVGVGAATLVFTPVLAVALMLTVIGLPIGLMLLAGWAMLLPIAFIVGSYTLGAWMTALDAQKPRVHTFLALLAGLALFTILAALPYVGGIVALIVIVGGFGVVTMIVARAIKAQYGVAKRTRKETK